LENVAARRLVQRDAAKIECASYIQGGVQNCGLALAGTIVTRRVAILRLSFRCEDRIASQVEFGFASTAVLSAILFETRAKVSK
jgi:hypothetical protein